jgi:hypothetical protein
MSMQRDLRDSLHREMLVSGRAWSSEEIARSALKIVSDPARADRLIRAILGADPRFLRRGSAWQAGSDRRPALGHYSFVLVETLCVSDRSASAPLLVCSYDPASLRVAEIVRVMQDGSGLDRAAALLEGRLPVSLTAQATRRAIHRFEQTHALPASADRLLDLRALTSLLDGGQPGRGAGAAPAVHASDLSTGQSLDDGDSDEGREQLDDCRCALEGLLEQRGGVSLEDLDGELERSRRATKVDFSLFHFGPEDISSIPARPGIYRFIGEAGRLLYVGKSRDLGRRVASYFRPLAADHTRRAGLLAEVRVLEWETTPSELEALILEGETIRRERPPFNQQIEIHSAGELTTAREANLAFVLCEGDPDHVSVFFLREGKGWARGRLSRIPGKDSGARAEAMASAWLAGRLDGFSACDALDEVDGILVVRYLRLHRERIDRLHADEFPNAEAAGEGLAHLAARERPAWDPWVLRSTGE